MIQIQFFSSSNQWHVREKYNQYLYKLNLFFPTKNINYFLIFIFKKTTRNASMGGHNDEKIQIDKYSILVLNPHTGK